MHEDLGRKESSGFGHVGRCGRGRTAEGKSVEEDRVLLWCISGRKHTE